MTITQRFFFNKASKNEKVESDFDKPVVIESETTEAVPEPEPIENILDDEPADEIEEVADVDAEREEASQSKRYISAKSERISGEVIAAYAPVKSAEEVMAEMEQISEKIDSVDVYTEPVMAKTEPEQPAEATMEEIRLIEQLADGYATSIVADILLKDAHFGTLDSFVSKRRNVGSQPRKQFFFGRFFEFGGYLFVFSNNIVENFAVE